MYFRSPNSVRIAAFGGTLAIFLSCVSNKAYDDAVASAKYHQTSLHEKEQYVATLEAENDRLKRALAMNDVSALSEAGFGGDLESRLSELQSKIDGLGRPLKDIEKFDVEGGYVVMVQDKILFDSGSSALNAAGRDALMKVAADIHAKPHGRVWVRGHTDSDPVAKPATKERFPHGNLQLATARAVEVATALTAAGSIDASDVAVEAFGQYEPIRPNSSADNKRLNRRVEIFVSDGGTDDRSGEGDPIDASHAAGARREAWADMTADQCIAFANESMAHTNWNGAVGALSRAIEIEGGNFIAHRRLYVALRGRMQSDELEIAASITDIRNSIRNLTESKFGRGGSEREASMDKSAQEYIAAADSAIANGEWTEAIENYHCAIRLMNGDEKNEMFYARLRSALSAEVAMDERLALTTSERMCALAPRDGHGYYCLASIWARRGNAEKCAEALRSALRLRPALKHDVASSQDFAGIRTHPALVELLGTE